MAPLAPGATLLLLDWSRPPLVCQFYTSPLTSVRQAPILMPFSQQLSLLLSHDLQNNNISPHARYIKLAMQYRTQMRLTPLNLPHCSPPWFLSCLTRLSLVATMLPLFPNFSVIPYQSLLHPIGVLICLTFPSVQLPTCTVKSYHSL